MHNTTQTAQSHRTDCAASGSADSPLAAAVWGAAATYGRGSEGVIEARYAAVYQLESGCPVPRRLSAARLSSKWGLADCHGTTAGDLGKHLIEELLARLALCTSFAARRIDRDGLANRETQRLQLDPTNELRAPCGRIPSPQTSLTTRTPRGSSLRSSPAVTSFARSFFAIAESSAPQYIQVSVPMPTSRLPSSYSSCRSSTVMHSYATRCPNDQPMCYNDCRPRRRESHCFTAALANVFGRL